MFPEFMLVDTKFTSQGLMSQHHRQINHRQKHSPHSVQAKSTRRVYERIERLRLGESAFADVKCAYTKLITAD